MAQNFNCMIFSRATRTSYLWKIVFTYTLLYLKFYFLANVRHNKLLQEAFIFTPEQSYVRNIIQDHGQPLQTQAKCPANFILSTSCNKQTNKIKIKKLKFTTWKIADKMFTYLPRKEKKKKKGRMAKQKCLQAIGKLKIYRLMDTSQAARLGVSLRPGLKSGNKAAPFALCIQSFRQSLRNAAEHYTTLYCA